MNIFRKIFAMFLDALLPQKAEVRMLEEMGAEELRRHAPRAAAPPLPDAFAFFSYRDPLIKTAIWELKYRGNRRIAALLAACLHDELVEALAELAQFENFTAPLVVPVPLSPRRFRERGFNQCELLLKRLVECDGGASFAPAVGALEKIRNTESQTKSAGRQARLRNLAGCFAVPKERAAEVRGKNIILLDDVVTTGATAEEARSALLGSGARRVIVYAIAH